MFANMVVMMIMMMVVAVAFSRGLPSEKTEASPKLWSLLSESNRQTIFIHIGSTCIMGETESFSCGNS